MNTGNLDVGARTIKSQSLTFFNTTGALRTKFSTPFTHIFHDLDGTLSGLGSDSYVVYDFPHLQTANCFADSANYDGFVCNS